MFLTSVVVVALTSLLSCLAFRIHPQVKWREDDVESLGRAYLAGRLDAESYRRSLMGSYGLIQPGLEEKVRAEKRGHVLVVGGYYWGIPAPVIADDVGWSPIRHIVSGADSRRVAIRFRQLDIRWLVYDAEWGSWARTVESPYPWTSRELRAYADFAKSHFQLLRSTNYEKPGFGMQWVYRLSPHDPAPRVAVLPGTDAAFGTATMSALRGDMERAIVEYMKIYGVIPDVTQSRVVLGDALIKAGRTREGYAHLRIAEEDGLIKFDQTGKH
jgi:hypothetical protein